MDGFFYACERDSCIHKIGITNQNCSHTNQAVKYRDQFGHFGHLHTVGHSQSDGATDQHGEDNNPVTGYCSAEDGGEYGDCHADNAV